MQVPVYFKGFFRRPLLLLVSAICCSVLLPRFAQATATLNDRGFVGLGLKQQQRGAVDDAYWQWKARYLRQGPCRENERYVESKGDAGKAGDITVSEAHGYGMLALVAMADIDESAHADFDGMVALMLRHPVGSKLPLMAWRLDAYCGAAAHEVSAPDGDMDMAYALLQADARWGSDGRYAYGVLAVARINALMEHVVQGRDTPQPIVGLWEDIDAGDSYAGGTRLSDYMMAHFKAFYTATGDVRWLRLVSHGYELMQQLQQDAKTGLLPDFAVYADGKIQAAPANYLEGALDGGFGYNACRVPWRLAADYDRHADPRAAAVLRPLTRAVQTASAYSPEEMPAGLWLSGAAYGEQTGRMAFVAPTAVALAALSPWQRQTSRWQADLTAGAKSSQGYYNDTLRLLALLSLSDRGPTL